MQDTTTITPEILIAAALAERPHFVTNLRHLVEIESPSGDQQAFPVIFDWLEAELEPLGFACDRLPEASHSMLLATSGEVASGRRQLVLGHVDTVWARGTLAKMPFIVEDDVARGPGAFDMKGGICQLLAALRLLNKHGLQPAYALTLLFTTDEETGSQDSRYQIEQCASMVERAFILEPALGEKGVLKSARKGVGHYRINIAGQAAHAGLDPSSGASAILELSHVVQKLFALNDPSNGITVNVGTIDGGVRTNVVAPASSCCVEVRVETATDAARMHQAITSIRTVDPACSIHIDGAFDRPPMEATVRNMDLVKKAVGIAHQLGFDLDHGAAGGASDGNFTSLHCATLDGLGAVGDGAHANHEHLRITQSLQRAGLLAGLIMSS